MTVRVVLPQHQIGTGGGIATYVRSLTDALIAGAPDDIELLAVCPRSKRQTALGRLLVEQTSVALAARRGDVLHMTEFRVPMAAARACSMVTIHDVSFISRPELYSPAARRYKASQLDAMLRWPPAIISCVSEHTLGELVAHRPSCASRARVLSPGLAPLPAAQRPRARQPRHILTIGSYHRRKNLGVMLAAYRLARERGLDLPWISVGPTAMADPDLLAAMRSQAGVTVAGFVGEDQLQQLWDEAAMLVVPSVMEGFSFPAVEAMQRGVPVIASRGSALDETVGDSGLRVEHEDSEAWASTIIRVGRDEALSRELSASGTARVGAMSWERRLPAFVSAYREIAAS